MAAGLLAACGGGGSDPVTDPSSAATSPAEISVQPVTDAAALRDRLLAIAQEQHTDAPGGSGDYGIYKAWIAEFPDLKFVSVGESATATKLSAYPGFYVAKPYYAGLEPFTVMDTNGNCAGGAILQFKQDPPSQFIPVTMTGSCRGQDVEAAAADQIKSAAEAAGAT
jgi:hypothetical protein